MKALHAIIFALFMSAAITNPIAAQLTLKSLDLKTAATIPKPVRPSSGVKDDVHALWKWSKATVERVYVLEQQQAVTTTNFSEITKAVSALSDTLNAMKERAEAADSARAKASASSAPVLKSYDQNSKSNFVVKSNKDTLVVIVKMDTTPKPKLFNVEFGVRAGGGNGWRVNYTDFSGSRPVMFGGIDFSLGRDFPKGRYRWFTYADASGSFRVRNSKFDGEFADAKLGVALGKYLYEHSVALNFIGGVTTSLFQPKDAINVFDGGYGFHVGATFQAAIPVTKHKAITLCGGTRIIAFGNDHNDQLRRRFSGCDVFVKVGFRNFELCWEETFRMYSPRSDKGKEREYTSTQVSVRYAFGHKATAQKIDKEIALGPYTGPFARK